MLEVERTYKEGNSSVSSVYYYGNGLIYEKNSDIGLLVYHYDHLGSTKAVTDENGELVAEFSYGSYGELLTDKTEYREEVPEMRFLYNGQMGVITDDNSLYYMRARYYNPQIKRFINQDILTGNIGNNKSLNRYSYVEGNPVSYTDPFGLSPYKMISDGIHNTLEALGVIPGIGNIFDGINTAYYLLEGNLPMAFYSAMCAMPYGDIVKLKKYAPKVIGFFGGAEIAAQLLQSAGCDSIQTIFSSETRQYSYFAEYEDTSQLSLDDYLNIALDTSLLTMNVTASFKTPVTGKVDASDVNVGRVDGGNAGYKGGKNANTIDNPVDLTDFRKDHILNNHRYGAGKPDKTEFPQNWSDEKILHYVSDVATDPNATWGMGKWDSPYAISVREGIEIRVDFYPDTHPRYSGKISTAYPLNTPKNPPKGGGN